MSETVVLYELNEVPWLIVDLFVEKYPDSCLAEIVQFGRSYTTVNHDEADLSPWRTWPTFHKSLVASEHNSFELGQDPNTFHGNSLWDAVDDAGYSVGLFGVLQSWPARAFKSGGFYVPDTFARDSGTIPVDVQFFQDFNLRMTAENSFSSDAPLSLRELVGVGFGLASKGLTAQSIVRLGRHLVSERADARYKAARPMMQVLPSFDLFWKLYRTYRPSLGVFFTNHVASMMHRFWGDAVESYGQEYGYEQDEVFGTFVMDAMLLADRQLRVLKKAVDSRGGARLIVASSMGQGPVQHRADYGDQIVLEAGERLLEALGYEGASVGLAMFPKCSLEFPTDEIAEQARLQLRTVSYPDGRNVLGEIERRGCSVSFRTVDSTVSAPDSKTVCFIDGGGETVERSFAQVGLGVHSRLGGDNTAYHVPEGILLDYTRRGPVEGGRAEVDVLDVAPSLLVNCFRAAVPNTMKGRVLDDLFATDGV